MEPHWSLKMNEFEQQLIDKLLSSVHDLELTITKQICELEGKIESRYESQKALYETVQRSIETDTKRLDKHSEEIDQNTSQIAKLEEWKEQFQRQISNKIAVGQSISAIGAVVIAFLLSKFLG